jgi:hypothetical protein
MEVVRKRPIFHSPLAPTAWQIVFVRLIDDQKALFN